MAKKTKRAAKPQPKKVTPLQSCLTTIFVLGLCIGSLAIINLISPPTPTPKPAAPPPATLVTEVTFTPTVAVTLTETSLYNALSDAITPTTISDHDLTMTAFSLPDAPTPSYTYAPKPRTYVPVTLPPTLPNRQSTIPPKPTTAPISTIPPKPTSAGSSCPSLSYKCTQLTCAQAYACLAAGNKSLDRDGDGKPCETQCNAH